MSENSSKSVAEIHQNSKNPKKQVFDMSTAFLKKFIFGNKNRPDGGVGKFIWSTRGEAKHLFGRLGGGAASGAIKRKCFY